MFGDNRKDDILVFMKAFLTNQLAGFAPGFRLRFRRQTGRGAAEETPAAIAKYYRQCFFDYFNVLKIPPHEISSFLLGRTLLEYGPGDMLGLALLMVAWGAEKVICVDRFPLVHYSPINILALKEVIRPLEGEALKRAQASFNREPVSGLRKDSIEYVVSSKGLGGFVSQVDIIFSRAVLEHVNDLSRTFIDMQLALKPGGLMIHKVDLGGHGLEGQNCLDFLTWPESWWNLMYSQKGAPNRCRVDVYREELKRGHFDTLLLEPTKFVKHDDLVEVRPHLPKAFRDLSDENLSWLGFWVIAQKPK